MGKRVVASGISRLSSDHKRSINEQAGLDFGKMITGYDERELSRTRSHKPVDTVLKEKRNSSYLYQVFQPELSERHSKEYK